MIKQKNKPDLYSSTEAQEYLGIDVATYKYHVYRAKNLQPDHQLGRSVAFLKSTLDTFRERHLAEGFTLDQAAEYLEVDRVILHNHFYYTKLLVPSGKRSNAWVFDKTTLDAFKASVLSKPVTHKRGRPRKARGTQPVAVPA